MIRLVVIAWLALCGVVSAQLSGGVGGFPGPGTVHSSGFTPSCAESTAFLARASTVTLDADKTNYDTLICGLVTDGLCCATSGGGLDALYIFAAPDSTAAQLNLVQATFNGSTSLSFTAYQGFTGASNTPFLTSLTPNSGTKNFTQNSASIGVYSLTSSVSANGNAIGTWNSIRATLWFNPGGVGVRCLMNQASSFVNDPSGTNSQGFWACVRTDSATVGISRNGAAMTTAASTSAGLDNSSITVFCEHQGGTTYSGCTTDQFAAAFIGSGLNDTQIGNLSSRINTFMTAYGINVY